MKTISYEWLKEQPATVPIEVNDAGDILFAPTQSIKVGDLIILKVTNGALKAGQYSLLNKGNRDGDYSSKTLDQQRLEKVCAKMIASTPSNIAGGLQTITFQFIDDLGEFTAINNEPSANVGDTLILKAPVFLIAPTTLGDVTVRFGGDAPQTIIESAITEMCVIIPYLVIDTRVVGNVGYASFIQFTNRTLLDAKVSMDALITNEGCTKSSAGTVNNAFTIPAQSILIVRQEDITGYLALANTELWRVALTLYIDADDNGVDVVVWQLGPQMRTVAPCYYNSEKRTWA